MSDWSSPCSPSPLRPCWPAATEDLYVVGAGHQVVAVDADSDYPAQAPVTKLSGLSPNMEGQYADHLVLLHQGRIEAAGPAAAVLTEERIARIYAAQVAVHTEAGVTTVPPPASQPCPAAASALAVPPVPRTAGGGRSIASDRSPPLPVISRYPENRAGGVPVAVGD
ncbi:MAG TPA: hypothetical protein VFV73_39780 [Streptosporangiaceae bacterium]|nr:hypothetical protein [Streptosporangiaceae bacterium]